MSINGHAEKNNLKVLGILIRSERINKGFSLRDLGQLTNISHTLISNIEKGKQVPAPDTLADIFKFLDLEFYANIELSNEFKNKSKEVYDYLFNQEYEEAYNIFKKLEKNEDKYVRSLDVVKYILLKCFYYTLANEQKLIVEENLTHYEKVLEFFNDEQIQMFHFIKGLHNLNEEHYNIATECFYEALALGNKDLDVFINEYNIISLVRQYKFIDAFRLAQEVIKEFEDRTIYVRAMKTKLQVARILYNIAKNDETEELVEYVNRFAVKFNVVELIEECAMLRAAIQIRLKNFDKAQELISTMPNQQGVTAVLLKFKIAFLQEDEAELEKLYNEISKFEQVTSHKKVWLYLQVQAMSKIESLYNKEQYIKNINELVDISVSNMDQEMIGLAHNYLIMYYHEERSYKKALEIAENLLHLKKIRIEND